MILKDDAMSTGLDHLRGEMSKSLTQHPELLSIALVRTITTIAL